jgi:hypothetical protein
MGLGSIFGSPRCRISNVESIPNMMIDANFSGMDPSDCEQRSKIRTRLRCPPDVDRGKRNRKKEMSMTFELFS